MGTVRIDSKCLVMVGYVLILFKYMMATVSVVEVPPVINNIIMVIGMLCFASRIIVNTYNEKMLFLLISLLFFGFIILFRSGETIIILTVLLGFAVRGMKVDEFVKSYFYIAIILFISVILLSLITQKDISMYGAFREEGIYELRYMFGFSHPNSMQNAWMKVVTSYVVIEGGAKHRKEKYIILGSISYIIFLFSDSRAAFLVTELLLLMSFFRTFIFRIIGKKFFSFVSSGLYLLLVIFTLFAVYTYGRYSWVKIIDSAVTGRFLHAYRFLMRFPVSLFGNDISSMSTSYTLDCGIISTLLVCGSVFFTLLCIFIFVQIYKIGQQKKYLEIFVILSFMIYSMAESVYCNPFVNLGLFFCIISFWEAKTVEKVKSKIEQMQTSP